jgi:hypothetical protein
MTSCYEDDGLLDAMPHVVRWKLTYVIEEHFVSVYKVLYSEDGVSDFLRKV